MRMTRFAAGIVGLCLWASAAFAQVADLSILKTGPVLPVAVGNNVLFSITVTNNGPTTATNVVVADTFPASTDFVDAVVSQGTVVESAGSSTATLGSLGAGQQAAIGYLLNTLATGTIVNTAEVTASSFDPDPSNNASSATVTVTNPNPLLVGAWDSIQELISRNGTRTVRGRFLVGNAGVVNAGSFRVNFYYSTDPVFDPGDQLLKVMRVRFLRTNVGISLNFRARLNAPQVPTEYIIAVIDPEGVIPEMEPGHNIVSILLPGPL